jgi:N-acetylglucosaminyl-diphospho-decaprenol L-rhamnosyltransferase
MKSDKKLDISVIIVNYNTADFLGRCLISVARQTDVDVEVIVVDNCSKDGSPDFVREHFPWVRLMANDQNLGFSRANNQALKDCSGTYVYFLNPDTEIRSGAFKNMVDFMDSHPNVGLAGTQLVHPDGSPQSSIEIRYPGQRYARDELKGLKGDIAWVMGSSMMARLEVIRGIDGFDEHFFLYGEDLDLCLRIRKSGWIIGFIPEAVVVHWGGQSERNNLPVEVWEKKIRAEALFYRKHFSPKTVRAIDRWNFYQACWRIFTLKLELLFTINKKPALTKLEKYQLVQKMLRRSA